MDTPVYTMSPLIDHSVAYMPDAPDVELIPVDPNDAAGEREPLVLKLEDVTSLLRQIAADPVPGAAALVALSRLGETVPAVSAQALPALPPDYDRLVPLLAGALLAACKLDPARFETPSELVHEQWRRVNQVAGAIAGHVAALDSELVDRARLAGAMMEDVQGRFLTLIRGDQSYPTLDGATMPGKIVGTNGLVKRLSEALAALGVRP